jgi:hypothetical protein
MLLPLVTLEVVTVLRIREGQMRNKYTGRWGQSVVRVWRAAETTCMETEGFV